MRFIDGAVKNGIKKDVAAGIFLKIEPFAEYGFNKSHAAAYAIIAYQTAFLKCYYPNEFFSASMTMDISSQSKLGEFYEELNRLDINVVRPNINKCYADFRSDNENFYYALGAIKNVGFEAISSIVEERKKNGKFKSINNFIERINPKNLNKLQLEGLVKAGAFDNLVDNRQSLYDSIPSLILKSKNIFENKSVNQSNLFEEEGIIEEDLLKKIEDWKFEDRLSKEFEAVGFFISDHPLNQFRDSFEDYNIISYIDFNNNEINEANIAATILKIQEKKTQKGNSYAIVKLTDLGSVFELFLFSDVLESNRDILIEGNSIILTLTKNNLEDDNRFKRINVRKVASLKNLYEKPINNIEILIKDQKYLNDVQKILEKNGQTQVIIKILDQDNKLVFNLKNRRLVDRKNLNLLKNQGISTNIF